MNLCEEGTVLARRSVFLWDLRQYPTHGRVYSHAASEEAHSEHAV